jgi:hypothetical protein
MVAWIFSLNKTGARFSPSNPSTLVLSTPSSAPQREPCEQIGESDGTAAGPLTDARDHRRVDAPPSSSSSAGSFIACKPAMASPRASTTAPSRTMVMSHSRRWRRPLPARRVDPSTAGGGGHGVNTKKSESRNPNSFKFISFSFLLPQLRSTR